MLTALRVDPLSPSMFLQIRRSGDLHANEWVASFGELGWVEYEIHEGRLLVLVFEVRWT
jgi:hypothetical protein